DPDAAAGLKCASAGSTTHGACRRSFDVSSCRSPTRACRETLLPRKLFSRKRGLLTMTKGVWFAAALVAVSWIGTWGNDPPGILHAGQSRGVSQKQNAPAGNVAAGRDRWNE